MVKAAPINNFAGFGDSNRPGEYYYSQGFSRSQYGITPILKITKRKDSSDISGLGTVQFFAKRPNNAYCVDNAGKIYEEGSTIYNFTLVRTNSQLTSGNGLLGDQKDRLLYPSRQYLGMYDGTTFTDNWKDFGVSTTEYRDGDNYQGGSYFCNKNYIAYLASDDSWNAQAFTMPTGYLGRAIRSGRNGILTGWNIGTQGVLTLWDSIADRSITDWLWLDSNIQDIARYGEAGWIVTTKKSIVLTNGYSTQVLFEALDSPLNLGQAFNVLPRGTFVNGDRLHIQNTVYDGIANGLARWKSGHLIFNLKTRLFEYAPVSTGNSFSVRMFGMLPDNKNGERILLGYTDDKLAQNYIGTLDDTGPSTAIYISEPQADSVTEKVAQAVVLNIGTSNYINGSYTYPTLTFDASVKLYNFKRPLWQATQTTGTGADTTKLRVDGTITNFKAEVGDEVTVLTGTEAGKIRHITAIASQGTSSEEWTVNAAYSAVVGTGIHLQLQPFKLVEKKTYTGLSELKDMYFMAGNNLTGKKFLVKVVFENMSCQPEIHNAIFVYDDLQADKT